VNRSNKTTGNPNPPSDNNPADEGVEDDNLPPSKDSPTTSPGQATVRINNTPESDPPMTSQATTSTTRSILQGSTTHQITPETDNFQTNNDPSRKTILTKQKKLLINLGEDGQRKAFHVEDFAGLYPTWPIIKVANLPTGNTKEERMNMFIKCITALFGEILYVNNSACIAPLEITDNNNDNYISDKAQLPSNFTKLGKWIMISGGSWVFNKKEKGSSNMYTRFCLKSQVPTEEIINRMSFKFTHLGGTKLYKKQMQAMETETPMMLLFVSNGTEHSSIASDMKQLIELAYDDIKTKLMMPEEYENRDMPAFSLKVNAPCLPEKKKNNNKAYDHLREQGKKSFHFEVAKSDIPFFKFLCNHAHRMKLDTKYFGKFAKLMDTLGNNAPVSNCTRLRRCIQGHLNFHLSSTSITIHGINNLDTAETLKNPANGAKIVHLSLRDMLYCIHTESGTPLFLQLSQRGQEK
jgi:hypothetical protein